MQEYTGGTYMPVFSVPFTIVAGSATIVTAYVYSFGPGDGDE